MSSSLALELHPLPLELESPFPPDWPLAGPIDLAVHDLPHASASLEWWYLNTHIKTEAGRELAIFAAFFRYARGRDEATGQLLYTHSVAWALSDPSSGEYHPCVTVDTTAPELGLAKLAAATGNRDERLQRALREVMERGEIPGPTRMFRGNAVVGSQTLLLDFGGNRLRKSARGYELELRDPSAGISCKLTLIPSKPATRHGNDGVLHGVNDEVMFYYFIPRCEVAGSVFIDGARESAEGTGWYDHEFGFVPPSAVERASNDDAQVETTWRWFSLQLEGGTDVSVYLICRRDTGDVIDNWTIVSGPDGTRHEHRDACVVNQRTWRSTRSFVTYPIGFQLSVPSARLSLDVEATFADQEVLSVISDPGFWEGHVTVQGTLQGRAACGKGWVECKGYRFDTLDEFFTSVGEEVRERVARRLPLHATGREVEELVVWGYSGAADRQRYVADLDGEDLSRTLVAPIRAIVDRGGKGWRSYAALACIDVVGGNSQRFLNWLAIPEMLHVGSLIVDDVEDGSSVRRGGPSCHVLHGVPNAINAGNAAYFLAEPPVLDEELPDATKLQIYRLYFDAMRAGHAGQALDLQEPGPFVERVLDAGLGYQLSARVLGVHRLKTAAPAGMMARVGALLGGGNESQVEGLGEFFEAVGLAFQIVDDVLNLRGFEAELKERGEDIRNGKLTLPVAKALESLSQADARRLWSIIAAKPHHAAAVHSVIDRLERLGAIDACMDQAHALVEQAWTKLDPLLEESQYKVMFRAFSWYVLERHY
jgi:geranylgeranyl pyrophosphate synthase/predicted secreted hydrolase